MGSWVQRTAPIFVLLALLLPTLSIGGCAPGSSEVAANNSLQDDGSDATDFDAIVGGDEVRARKTRVASAVLQMAMVDRTTDEHGQSSLSKSRCTATLIGERVVLTAAHCIDRFLHRKLYRMRIDPRTSQAKSAGFPVIIVGHEINRRSSSVTAIAVPPGFRKRHGVAQPDLALLFLDRPMQLPTQALHPRLDGKGLVKIGGHVMAMGFGHTKYDPLAPLKSPNSKGLFQKSFRVIDSRKVDWRDKRKSADTFFMGIDRGQPEGSICQGDSGGPVFSHNKEPRSSAAITLVGVISRSEVGCDGFSAAVSVNSHLPWIQRQAAKWRAKLF